MIIFPLDNRPLCRKLFLYSLGLLTLCLSCCWAMPVEPGSFYKISVKKKDNMPLFMLNEYRVCEKTNKLNKYDLGNKRTHEIHMRKKKRK